VPQKGSVTSDLRATIFDQAGNLPIAEDGPTLFKKLTTFTMVASLQLSMISFKNILDFDPADHKFNIPTINTKINHLFVLATTRKRQLLDSERIQHTLAVYDRIKQPEPWAQWVRIQIDKFDDGLILVCQDFMNSATLKYNKIITSSVVGGFKGSVSTIQEDIVAMVAGAGAAKRKRTPPSYDDKAATPNDQKPAFVNKKLPPFVKHYRSFPTNDATIYKVGDSKTWNNAMWYFCDCPTHRDKVKWHTHPTDTCRTCQRSKEGKSDNIANPPLLPMTKRIPPPLSPMTILMTLPDFLRLVSI
jgi:hypothetical protein